MSKPLIYIAGPVTKGWLPHNIREAIGWGEHVAKCGGIPIVPHTHGTLWEFISPQPYEFWMEISLELVRRSDGVFRFPGESAGADQEAELARSLGIPLWVVGDSVGALQDWLLYCARRRASQ